MDEKDTSRSLGKECIIPHWGTIITMGIIRRLIIRINVIVFWRLIDLAYQSLWDPDGILMSMSHLPTAITSALFGPCSLGKSHNRCS